MKRNLIHSVTRACLVTLSLVPIILAMVGCKQEEETIPAPIKPPADGIQPSPTPGSGGSQNSPAQQSAPQGQATRH